MQRVCHSLASSIVEVQSPVFGRLALLLSSRLSTAGHPGLLARSLSDEPSTQSEESGAAGRTPEPTEDAEPPALVVVGGSGFVGSRVCQAAQRAGLPVIGVNRSGRPDCDDPWVSEVEWVKGDALHPSDWDGCLKRAVGVVSCVGAFGSNETMMRINGDANVAVIRAAADADVPRFAFISSHDFRFPDFFLQGYFQGKRKAEAALKECFPNGGVALRPGFIHGTRRINRHVSLPLSMVGSPLELMMQRLPTRTLAALDYGLGAPFVPPVSVEAVGRKAVEAATNPAVPAGVMDVWTIGDASS